VPLTFSAVVSSPVSVNDLSLARDGRCSAKAFAVVGCPDIGLHADVVHSIGATAR